MKCPYHPDAEVVTETFDDGLPSHMTGTWTDHRCADCDYLIKRVRS